MRLQKSQASESSDDTAVFSKASFVIKQERSECSDRCCDCHSPPAFLVHPSEVWVFQYQITTPAAHWKPRLLRVPNQHGQDSSCPPVLSDTRPYWPRKHDVQGTFKAKSLHEPTTWTSYPCDIEIISKTRWSEPELGKLLRWACRDGSSFLNLHGNSTVFSASDLAAFEALIFSISLDLWYLWAKTGTNTFFLLLTDYHQSDTDTIHVASFGKPSFGERLKWNRHDELSLVFDIKVWKWNETASDRDQLHKILAALWSEGCLSWLMR